MKQPFKHIFAFFAVLALTLSTANASVLGSSLFQGGFDGQRGQVVNKEYLLQPGDRVRVSVWGEVSFNDVLVLDALGNIFLPNIGPVNLSGVPQDKIGSQILNEVNRYYKDTVSVYAQLENVQPISVFVSGWVSEPGRYSGNADDSLLYYLNLAKGIPAHGSYRAVRVLREGKTVAVVDLYDFFKVGVLPNIQLKEKDSIFVEPAKKKVSILKDGEEVVVELKGSEMVGKEVLQLFAEEGFNYILLKGVRDGQAFSQYLSIPDFVGTSLGNNDVIEFVKDYDNHFVSVSVEGAFLGKDHYVVPVGTKLKDLLMNIQVNPAVSDYSNVYLKRKGVATRQKVALHASLERLEASFLNAPSSTVEESNIRTAEAGMIQKFVEKARQVEPDGKMVVSVNKDIVDINLNDGDVIVIPEKTNVVLVSGEVLFPKTLAYQEGVSVEEYLARAGGLSHNADSDSVMVIRANGEVFASSNIDIASGDEILVLPVPPTKSLQTSVSLTQILYQVAVAASVALRI